MNIPLPPQPLLCDLLDIPHGITAVIGGGGKTTLTLALARELSSRGKVILCTSTHIFPPDELPLLLSPTVEQIRSALESQPGVCVGTPGPEGKLSPTDISFSILKELCDFVIVEADGSRHRPIKAHAAHEPAIPPGTDRVLCVLGADGFFQPMGQAVHRPELMQTDLGGQSLEEPVDPAALGKIAARHFPGGTVLLNKVDSKSMLPPCFAFAQAYLAAGGASVIPLSLKSHPPLIHAVWRN